MKHLLAFLVALGCCLGILAGKKAEPVVVAYVTSWTKVMPDPTVMTHINYAFGHVNEQFNGVRIDNEQRLRDIVSLKKQQPKLLVMLSIGGWGSGRFSEMAASEENRKAFAKDCQRVCQEFGLDGIDIDWEYPTQNSAGISSSPQDTENFTLLMRDLRQALGKKLWLTLASVGSAQYIDFRSCIQYLDMVNVMAYDMGSAPKHHAALYRSKNVGWNCASECVEAHRKAGVPDSKIVLGMPFYGRGKDGVYMKYADRGKQTLKSMWDVNAKAPYLANENGELAIGYENPRSIAVKCAYIKEQGLRGAMYWEYADDNERGELQRAVWQGILQSDKERNKATQKAAKRLAAVLAENYKREDITPDSFFHDWRNLRAEMLAEKDPTAQAIYNAAMGHLLCNNVWRSQSFDNKTKSHIDSIQEWSRPEYTRQAANYYAKAMQDVEALHAIKLPSSKPLTEQGKDDGIFGNDLLHVIWQAYQQDLPADEKKGFASKYGEIIDVYRRHGLREAALMLRLDSLNEKDDSENREKTLLRLREEYADIPACAEVCLRLASLSGKEVQERYGLLEEALKRYPKCREANEIKNQLASLRAPKLSGRFREMYYPDKDYNIPLQIKNMQTGSVTVYRIPLDFEFSDEEKDGTRLEQVKRSGLLLETLSIDMTGVELLKTKDDTLKWHSPSFGRYALVLDGTTNEKLEKDCKPQVILTGVSALTFMATRLPAGRERLMVTDVMSGEPQQGVKVDFYRKQKQEYTLIGEQTTDSRGIAEMTIEDRNSIYVQLSRGEDNAFEKEHLGWRSYYDKDDKLAHHLKVYTDRSIYRPGQMVYVGGIAYTQSHDQAPQVEAGAEFELVLYDANSQEVVKHKLKTDEFGTLQDSLQLPKSGLPGQYQIHVGNEYHDIRVEEYRRPTFQVEFDEAPAITLPVDSITLTGRALTYSQWPVANARVTGTYRWQQSWWYKRYSSSKTHNIDTLYTDEEGRFSIRVPVSKELSKEDLRWGQTLHLSVDVLSPEGETQQGSSRVTLCSTPLRMRGNVPEQENHESLQPWRFDLYSSNDKLVQGEVLCMLTQNGKEVKNFIVSANRDTIPEVLRSLPSGQYDLVAKAGGQWSMVNGQWSMADTASFKASFTIFSITDKRLIGKHELWLYTPCDTMSAERPVRFQVGTTLPEAWIYCLMTGENGLVRDTLLHLSDEAMMFEVPYEERFRHRLAVMMMLIHEGRCWNETLVFTLEQPDTRLRMHWDTFRDHLQPGQKEQWKFTLTRPDGKPASANVMLGMYDASLDALAYYGMSLYVDHICHRNVSLRVTDYGWSSMLRYTGLNLPLHFLPVEDYDFAYWNNELFSGAPVTRGVKSTRLGSNRLEERVYEMAALPAREYAGAVKKFDAAELDGLGFESADQALQGRIAGLDVVKNSVALGKGTTMRLRGVSAPEEEEEEVEADETAYVRSNLSELAFFYPQLRTDSKGQTSIDFTLPEGLTSWHLEGLAHTKDMMTARWKETIVAKKELMAELTLPRFLRNGDEATLIASIRNASEKRQKGDGVLKVYDAESNKSVKQMKFSFDIEPGKEAVFEMPLTATLEHPVLAVQWIAKAKDSSDGEVRYLPVLSDMQNVTETKTYMLKGDTTLRMDLSRLFANGNPKAVNKTLTVEHVSEPMTLVLQALPSLTAPVHNDVLSVASAYYGGSVAYHLAHKYEGLRTVIECWAEEENSQALESPLVKNQQLADILLNETPWVVEAQQQKASRERLVTLFNEMEQEQRRMTMLSALSARQHEDGSFGWFPGMRGSVWMTTEVATLLVRLGAIKDGILSVPERQILDKAMSYLEKEMHESVENLRKEKNPVLSLSQLRYLYIYIMYKGKGNDDTKYLLSLLKKQAEDLDREPRAIAAIVLQKADEEKKAQALMPRIHELLRHSDGMYLAYPSGSFTSIDRKVETHVTLMEAVKTVEPKETDLLAGMAEWLISQKRMQEWERPIQSADAVYALLQSDFNGQEGTWSGKITYDNQTHKFQKPDVSYGYVREQMEQINKAKEFVIEQSNNKNSVSWGAVYAQYQLPASEVEANREGMIIRRDVEIKNAMREGDRVHVRYTITADRDYEYVCLRAPRPAAAEPAQQLSGYHWQNGIGYYQAMHDASTEYFTDRLPRGTYVIEEDWLVSRAGTFLLPPARLTCLYAPEFQSQTAAEKYKCLGASEKPLEFANLMLSGNAEDVTFKSLGSNLYEAYARLRAGTFKLTGTVEGKTVTLSNNGDSTFGTVGSKPFSIAEDCVARITVNTAVNTITILPVTMNVRGNIAVGNPAIPYKGNGVFEGKVTLPETASQQWVDKTMYFALNNNDAYAIKRLQGAASRYALGEVEKGQSTENIYQNAGTYTITVDMKQMVYNISAPIDENRISVFGSSVANGQGATDYKGYRYLYGQQLIARHKEGRSETPFYTSNVSIGGNTTVNLLNRYDDLIRDFGRYVIFGLSLGNEGIHNASNQQAVFNQWRDNMLKLISKVRADGKIPMVMNNYTRGDYNESDYSYVKQLNLLIHQWDVPSTNVLGAIDKGNGQWADGYVSDTYHQNTAGHAEFMYAMVPSLFDAIKAGKAQPVRDRSKSMTLEAGKTIYFEPEETVHPFTLTVRIKGTEGQVYSITQASGNQQAVVRVNANGTVTYTAPSGLTVTSSQVISNDGWHDVTLTSYYAQRRTILYVDKVKAGEVPEHLSGVGLVTIGDKSRSREISELFFWRSGMSPEEISAVCDGRMLKSSLEIYAPLGGENDMNNLAQSTNRLFYGNAKD